MSRGEGFEPPATPVVAKNSGPLLHKVSALEPIWPAETLISIFSHCLHTLCLPKLKCRDRIKL